jgi:signal transduction histidine kinase
METSPLGGLADRYRLALDVFLDQGLQANGQAAHALGVAAVALGLETLDLAKIHEATLAARIAPGDSPARRDDLTRRGEVFFAEVLVPIEESHPTAIGTHADVDRLHESLNQRTLDLAESHRELQQQISAREDVEAILKNSEHSSGQLLEDSRILERQLQDMVHKILCASEEERKKMSLQLNDEIAQSLVSINIRLIALKKVVAANDASLNMEITTIQQLAEASAKLINRLAHEFSF